MFHLKTLLLAAFLLTTNVLAARISYYSQYRGGLKGPNGEEAHTSRAGNIADDKVQAVLNNIEAWSNNKYTAKRGKIGITVQTTSPAGSRAEANSAIQDMQAIVSRNTRSDGESSKQDEPKKDEPKKDEPKKDEPKKDEPKKDEPKKDEPKKDEPKTDEPKKCKKKKNKKCIVMKV
ncbi:hypothetical protein B0O99DRAFT_746483 [Bisporella sp. PMI_857]|nr:hypothetical protein B0O99DRAFT_746483 [Bisporella sp. PMI_857]